jgi:hypothetical protein
MGRKSTFLHHAPLFPTKEENGQRKKRKREEFLVDFPSLPMSPQARSGIPCPNGT